MEFLAPRQPLLKILLWLLAVGVLAGLVQILAWAAGMEVSILDKSVGSAVLISLALFLLSILMALDRRPMADYGLVADHNWAKHGLRGFATGLLVYAGYCAIACGAGVYALQPEQLSWYRCAAALLAGASAVPIAVTQQIIFNGYLLGMLRQEHGRLTSLVIPAMLFAAGCCLSKRHAAPDDLARLAIGMFLLAVLLGVLRLRMGNIALTSGVLAGSICVRKVVGKSRLLGMDGSEPLADWLAPGGDPRQAPALWLLLLAAIAASVVVLVRQGERTAANDGTALAPSFKRIMPFSNLMALTPLDVWLAALFDARMRVGLRYLPRFAVTLMASAINTVLSLPERLIAPLVLRHRVPDPVFIVGMPRSGTTHLHNLLALDPQFRAPRNYEVFNPHGFLTGWLTTAVMAPFLTWRRPMDAVQMYAYSPQEDEFALAGMNGCSPYWAFQFPKRISAYSRFWSSDGFSERQRHRWQQDYRLLLRKLTLFGRRRPLLKNPANTGRTALLKRMFPRAKFIHICRHPYAVYRSNQHLAQHGLVVFQLHDPDPDDCYATHVVANYRRLMDTFYQDVASLPPEDVAEVRFEDLERDPLGQVELIYRRLGLTTTPTFRSRLVRYLERVAGYRKNRLAKLSEDERRKLASAMGAYFARWDYRADDWDDGDADGRLAA